MARAEYTYPLPKDVTHIFLAKIYIYVLARRAPRDRSCARSPCGRLGINDSDQGIQVSIAPSPLSSTSAVGHVDGVPKQSEKRVKRICGSSENGDSSRSMFRDVYCFTVFTAASKIAPAGHWPRRRRAAGERTSRRAPCLIPI